MPHQPELVHFEPPRDLRPDERVALDVLLSKPFQGSSELQAQAELVKVVSKCSCCADIWFYIDRDMAAKATLRESVPVVANTTDGDGMFLQILLTTKDGYLASLEMHRGDSQPRHVFPNLRSEEVFPVDPIEDATTN